MVQRRCGSSLRAKPAQEHGIVGKTVVQHLDGNPTPEPDVLRDVDASARARADRGQQAVSTREHTADQVRDGAERHGFTVPAARGAAVSRPRPLAARARGHPGVPCGS